MRTVGVALSLVTLTFSAGVSASPPGALTPDGMSMAITQPLSGLTLNALSTRTGRRLSESGLMVLVGSGLLGLATIVRRATRP